MIDFKKLFALQKGLDEEIFLTHKVDYTSTFDKRVLALLVELGEFANETRCFKFWSFKTPSSKDVILDEYADAIHFFLSLGLAIGLEDFAPIDVESKEKDLTESLIKTYSLVGEFSKKKDVDSFSIAFSYFLKIPSILNYTDNEVEEAYLKKLDVNHHRQETGY